MIVPPEDSANSAQWIVGVVPCLPGFISAVNPSMTVSDAATELYYMNYLYGFLASAAVYSVLHWVLPDKKFNEFVQGGESAKEIQRLYNGKWDVTIAQAPDVLEQVYEGNGKHPESATASV